MAKPRHEFRASPNRSSESAATQIQIEEIIENQESFGSASQAAEVIENQESFGSASQAAEIIENQESFGLVGKLELFHSIFVGREDVCAMLNPRGHFEPCCRNAGNVGLCQRPVGACAKCKSQSFEPFGKDAAGKHMLGDGVYGTYPILPDGTCKYVVAEFAGPNWVEDACSYRDECESLNLAPALERDSSGNAGHVWLFFAIPVSCESARKLASSILALAMEKRHITSLYPYNRIFPSQDTAPEDGFGRVLAMPLQGAVKKDGNSLFLDSSFAAYPDQLEHLSCLAKVTPEDIERICNGKELGVASQKPLTVGLDVPETVHALKSEGLVIPKDGLSERALNRIIWLAAFENPDFLKAQALMMDVSKRKRVISTALESESSICLPVGAESAFLEMLKDAKSNCEIDDNRKTGAPIEENIKVSLTREQLDALNELIKADVGILRAPPAFKETLVAAAIIARKKVSTLILVTRIARLWHWVVSLQNCLKTSIGSSIIGDVSLGGDIDVALAPSLIERGRVIEKAKSYGMILVDECHLAYKEPLRSILMQSGAKHVYGFTSKPVAHKFCGEVLCHAGSSNQTARVFVPRFTSLIAHEDFHESTFREHWWSSHVTGFEVELKQKCLKRLDLEGNKERSELVIQDAEKAVKSRKIPLIAASNPEYAAFLCESLTTLSIRSVNFSDPTPNAGTPQVVVSIWKDVPTAFDKYKPGILMIAYPIDFTDELPICVEHMISGYRGEVAILDYVDIRVRATYQAYTKRLLGYASLGIEALADYENIGENAALTDYENIGSSQPGKTLFGAREFLRVFCNDIRNAKASILISSPQLELAAAKQVAESLASSRVQAKIYTRPPSNENDASSMLPCVKLLEDAGAVVETGFSLPNFASIDEKVSWHGSANILGENGLNSIHVRIESEVLAKELAGMAMEKEPALEA